jgi:hypothetical protein
MNEKATRKAQERMDIQGTMKLVLGSQGAESEMTHAAAISHFALLDSSNRSSTPQFGQ